MDARLQQALEHANYRQTLGIERQRLKDKCLAELMFAFNGGIFTASKELIAFTAAIKDYGSATILDSNDYPVSVDNLEEFHTKVMSTYFEATNRYLADYESIKQKRTAAKLVDL